MPLVYVHKQTGELVVQIEAFKGIGIGGVTFQISKHKAVEIDIITLLLSYECLGEL